MLSAYKFWLLLRALERKVNFSELLWDYQNLTNLKNIQITFQIPFKDSIIDVSNIDIQRH